MKRKNIQNKEDIQAVLKKRRNNNFGSGGRPPKGKDDAIYVTSAIFISGKDLQTKDGKTRSIITVMIKDLTIPIKTIQANKHLTECLIHDSDGNVYTDRIILPGYVKKNSNSNNAQPIEASKNAQKSSKESKTNNDDNERDDDDDDDDEESESGDNDVKDDSDSDKDDQIIMKTGDIISFSKFDAYDNTLQFGDIIYIYNVCASKCGDFVYKNCSDTRLVKKCSSHNDFEKFNESLSDHYTKPFTYFKEFDYKTYVFSLPSLETADTRIVDQPDKWDCMEIKPKDKDPFYVYELVFDMFISDPLNDIKGFCKVYLVIHQEAIMKVGIQSMTTACKLFQKNFVPLVCAIYPDKKRRELLSSEINSKANNLKDDDDANTESELVLFNYAAVASSAKFNVRRFLIENGWQISKKSAKEYILSTLFDGEDSEVQKTGQIVLTSDIHGNNVFNNKKDTSVINVQEYNGDVSKFLEEDSDWDCYIMPIHEKKSCKEILDICNKNVEHRLNNIESPTEDDIENEREKEFEYLIGCKKKYSPKALPNLEKLIWFVKK